jgi:hypothetical protein
MATRTSKPKAGSLLPYNEVCVADNKNRLPKP